MKKLSMLASALLAMLMLCSCGATRPAEAAANEDITYFSGEDTSTDYDESSATRIELGESISISGSGAVAQRGTVTIGSAGTYILSGELAEGQIVIEAPRSVVRLVLNGASLSCSYSAAIYVKAAKKTILTLASGTRNAVADGEARSSSDSIDAAIYSTADLTVNGDGSLAVSGLYKHGIVSKDALVMAGGSLSVSSVKTGVCGKDTVKLAGCTLVVDAGTNGIRAGNGDEDSTSGIYIKDGTYTIASGSDGIQADGAMLINGGMFSITSNGGSSAAPKKSGDTRGNRAMRATDADTQAEKADESADISAKGLKAGSDVTINGGTFAISAYDDAIHSNGSISINGGSLTLTSGDDGIHADNALAIADGVVDIPSCYEGLEGMTVSITGGTVKVTASDDAINAAAASDEESDANEDAFMPDMQAAPANDKERPEMPSDGDMTPPDMPSDFMPSDMPTGFTPPDMPGGMPMESATEGVEINISGGHVALCAGGDCIDSNGTLSLTGGTLYLSINGFPVIGNADAALDSDGALTIDGVSLLGSGSSTASNTDSLLQPAIVFYSETSYDAGTVVTLADQNGNVIFTHTPAFAFASVLASSPALKTGSVYTLTIGEDVQKIAMTDALTVIGEGTAEMMGGMGMGAGRRDQAQPPAEGETPAEAPNAQS